MTVRNLAQKQASRQRVVMDAYTKGFQAGEEHGFVEGVKVGLQLIEERATSLSEAPEVARSLYGELADASGGDLAHTIQGLQR